MKLHVNGVEREVTAEPDRTLLSVLRDDLGLTAAKYGCGEGECGACTVMLGDKPVRSCRTRIGNVEGRQITTLEGITPAGQLHPVQQAFLDAEAVQCGYCTCGMIVTAVALLRKNSNPSRSDVVEAMDGNICRCGVYQRIIHAVLAASKKASVATAGGGR
jgi:aerobic-type carbon monoxide dehydrogenase small subunit (CoxS/CutS family)